MEKAFQGSLSRGGVTCLGVGGGAATNTFLGRYVYRPGVGLVRALFVKTKGSLSNLTEQAIVPVQLGDLVIELEGPLPARPDNEDMRASAWEIVSLESDGKDSLTIRCQNPSQPVSWGTLDGVTPWEALGSYHNRDGRPFCG